MTRTLTRASLLVGFLAFLTVAGYAAGVDGKWIGDVNTPDGNAINLTMNFKVDGDKVTGTVTGPNGDIEISEGKMDGDTLQFVLNVDAGGQQLSFKVTGKLDGDDLKVKMDGGAPEMNFEFVAKRPAA